MTARFTDHILAPGLLAARPAPAAVPAGTLYPATDTGIVYRSDGAAWSTWFAGSTDPEIVRDTMAAALVAGSGVTLTPDDAANTITVAATGAGGGGGGRPLVDPTGLTWSWINQGGAAVATQGASILLSSPAESADNWHFRAKTVPAKPYSVIVHQKITRMDINYSGALVGWLQSSNNNFACFAQRGSGLVMGSSYSTTPFAISANYVETSAARLWEWVKLTDDATSRKIYVSADGYNWVLFHSVATNTTITPDRLIFGIEARNATYGIGLTVDSWEEGV